MRRISAVAPLVSTARVAALSLSVLALAPLSAAASAPPDEPPDDTSLDDDTVGVPPIGPDSPDFERQLAEISFRVLMADTDAAAAGSVACSEPDNVVDGEIICFHHLDDVVTVATTTASNGTGDFEFVIVSTGGEPAVDPEAREQADLLVAAEAERINNDAERFIAEYELDERIESVERYEFDTEASMVILEFGFVEGSDFDLGAAAWVNTQKFAQAFWGDGGSFRSTDATNPPGMRVTIDGETWESDHELMVEVADETISETDWLARASDAPVDSAP